MRHINQICKVWSRISKFARSVVLMVNWPSKELISVMQLWPILSAHTQSYQINCKTGQQLMERQEPKWHIILLKISKTRHPKWWWMLAWIKISITTQLLHIQIDNFLLRIHILRMAHHPSHQICQSKMWHTILILFHIKQHRNHPLKWLMAYNREID